MRGSGERRLSPSVCSFDGETTMKWRERESVAVWAEEEDDERERERRVFRFWVFDWIGREISRRKT